MANLIDAGFLNNFAEVFMFLFVFAILYGILSKIDFFKLQDKAKGLNAIIAITVALMVLMSGEVRAMVGVMVPWFFVLFLFLALMIISAMIFGVDNAQMVKVISKPEAFTWIIIFGVVILLFSIGAGFGQNLLEQQGNNTESTVGSSSNTGSYNEFSGEQTTNTGSYGSNLVLTLFHPKVLGLLLLGIVGLLAAIFLTKVDE